MFPRCAMILQADSHDVSLVKNIITSLTPSPPMLTAKSMNLIYQLKCTECNAFYIEETCCSLSNHMNGHCFTTTVSNPDLPIAIHTQSHQIHFLECWSVSVIHKLTDSIFPTNLKWHTNSSSNHVTTPESISINPPTTYSILAPEALTISRQSFLFYC